MHKLHKLYMLWYMTLFSYYMSLVITHSSSSPAELQRVCWAEWSCGWNLQVVWSFFQHTEAEVPRVSASPSPPPVFVTHWRIFRVCMSCKLISVSSAWPGVSLRATGVPIWTRICSCRTSTVWAPCVKLTSESCPTLCSPTSSMISLLWVACLTLRHTNTEWWKVSSSTSKENRISQISPPKHTKLWSQNVEGLYLCDEIVLIIQHQICIFQHSNNEAKKLWVGQNNTSIQKSSQHFDCNTHTHKSVPLQEAVAIQLEEERLVKIRDVLKELPAPHYR